MIVQALLTLLLFFSEGYVRYTTIALFLLIDLILFIGLLVKRWSSEELLMFAALFCSGVFILFYIFMKSAMTTVFGVALMFLFLVLAMLDLISKSLSPKDSRKFEKLQKPEEPTYYYDVEYDPRVISRSDLSEQVRKPEPVMHINRSAPVTRGKLTAKAVAYELEREAQQLKDAQQMIKEMDIYNSERELIRESKELENAQKQIDALKNASNKVKDAKKATTELKREAKEMMKVQKQIDDIKNIQELKKEAKAIKKADKQVKEIQFLNQQEKIVKQAKQIAKAQKQIDEMHKSAKKSLSEKPKVKEIVKVKTVNAKEESFYFATENGNKFHEPGCLAIKKVPKNKLTLFTSRKEAMKKGLQPCNVCIPK